MSNSISGEVVRAVSRLWAAGHRTATTAFASTEFYDLVSVCVRIYGHIKGVETKDNQRRYITYDIENILRASDTPWESQTPAAPEAITQEIDRAYTATSIEAVYLCPLDCADDLGRFRFGPCEIRSFSQAELDQAVNQPRLRKYHSNFHFDTAEFCQFQWLVVRIAIASTPNSRGFSGFLSTDFSSIDKINPHARPFPPLVDQALFVLGLFRWEEIASHASMDWRPFGVPWIYRVSDDWMTHPQLAPARNSMTWQEDVHVDDAGEETWYERPFVSPLEVDDANELISSVNARWAQAERLAPAQGSPNAAFNPLIRHFFVKAQQEQEIGQFLDHMIALEAALGSERDYDRQAGGLGGKRALVRRICNLLGDPAAGRQFDEFFETRSQFVHGRDIGDLRTGRLRDLRSLVRRVLCALLDRIESEGFTDRDRLLDGLV